MHKTHWKKVRCLINLRYDKSNSTELLGTLPYCYDITVINPDRH